MMQQQKNSLESLMNQMGLAAGPVPDMEQEMKSVAETLENSIEEHMKKAEESKKLNAQAPVGWPGKNRAFTLFAHQIQISRERAKNKKQEFKQTSVNGESPVSVTPLGELKPICLREMKVPQVHTGRYLPCRVIGEPFPIVCMETVVEDVNGDVEHIALYNFCEDLNDFDWLKPGTVMFVKEPYMKFGGAQTAIIRVDSPSDVVFVHPTNKELLEKAGALRWYKPETMSFDQLKKAGNEKFQAKNFKDALEFYERALRQTTDSASIALVRNNMAAALLELGRFGEAKENAEMALEGGANKTKALFRLGKAAYGMRRWREAIDRFQAVLDEDPSAEATKVEMEKAKARFRESETGEYDLKALEKAVRRGECFFDLADYVGPVKVADIPGKGKGLVLTKAVPKGTLLMASKAYAMSPSKDYEEVCLFISVNLITKTGDGYNSYRCKLKAVQRLLREPETAAEVYALYAGADFDRGESIPKGVIDVGRIERICSMNCYGMVSDVKAVDSPMSEYLPQDCGLWLLPSFMNHSCLESARRVFHGDMMFVYAVRDLKAGEELTSAYKSPFKKYSEREKALKRWGFQCDCKLCELERNGAMDERLKAVLGYIMRQQYSEYVDSE